MDAGNHILDLLPAYALGALAEDENRLVVAHLAVCEQCRDELDSYQSVLGQLAISAPKAAPSLELKQRILARTQEHPVASKSQAPTRRPLLQRLFPLLAGIGVFLILALSVTSLLLWRQVNQSMTMTGPQGMRAIALENTANAPQSGGIVIISSDGSNGVLVVDELKQLVTSQQYQAWLYKDGKITPGPVFSVDATGYRGLRIQAPESLKTYSSILVTIEPANGSNAPTGEAVLSGSLHNP